jgi:dynactin 1
MRQTTELNDLRAQTQTAQTESATAASQTAAVMSLNLKLQSSAAKNQAKNIELELRKLEAQETKELLGIIQVCFFCRLGGKMLVLLNDFSL